ncbi:MAG: helicase-associated domain-containing protein, partial [Chloroflexota bacterium]
SALSRPAAPAERAHKIQATDRILDDACTLLAGLRLGIADSIIQTHFRHTLSIDTLKNLLKSAALLTKKYAPQTENIQSFLEAERGDSLKLLFDAWQASQTFNELHEIPHLQAEGTWENNPFAARKFILEKVEGLDPTTWWRIPAFVSSLKKYYPDFQRPAGNYEAWYLRDTRTGDYMRGEQHWDAVEGELIRFSLRGPFFWLGLVSLAAVDNESVPSAFRLTKLAGNLIAGTPPKLKAETQNLNADSKLTLQIPPLFPRAVRYQLARFCQWQGFKKENYLYRITPASLNAALEQGLKVKHLLTLLRAHTSTSLPPNLVQSLDRWDQEGTQIHLEHTLVLRVNNPKILTTLRKSRAARFLGDPLGPTSIVVNQGAWQSVMDALAELGYLGQVEEMEENLND